MSTLTLRFHLPEERAEAEVAAHAMDWRAAVEDTAQELRRLLKHGGAGKEIDDFNTWFWGMLQENKLDPYE